MTPREIIAGILGLIVGLLIDLIVKRPEPCRRGCCVPGKRGPC